MDNAVEQQIEFALGVRPLRVTALAGGVSEVYRADLPPGSRHGPVVVVKVQNLPAPQFVDQRPEPQLEIEAFMLRYLAAHSRLPIPKIFFADDSLLVMEFLPGGPVATAAAQEDSGKLLAELHTVTQPLYGLERDTLIGGLAQPNKLTAKWVDFFREQRLLYMAREAYRAGELPGELLTRVEAVAGRLELWLPEPIRPALLHGDAWGGNVLADETHVTGFIDPAIYYGHPEIELAFTMLFHSFGPRLYESYAEHSSTGPIEKEFFTLRKDIYNLYPLLVHVRLFGASYVGQVDAILRRLGE